MIKRCFVLRCHAEELLGRRLRMDSGAVDAYIISRGNASRAFSLGTGKLEIAGTADEALAAKRPSDLLIFVL
jgi:hypothetical protein